MDELLFTCYHCNSCGWSFLHVNNAAVNTVTDASLVSFHILRESYQVLSKLHCHDKFKRLDITLNRQGLMLTHVMFDLKKCVIYLKCAAYSRVL